MSNPEVSGYVVSIIKQYLSTGTVTGVSSNTGQLTGAFYPLRSNPSGYATTGLLGAYATTANLKSTGAYLQVWTDTNYYPRTNPSGYISSGQVSLNNVVYTSGDQDITGNKHFKDGLDIGDSPFTFFSAKNNRVFVDVAEANDGFIVKADTNACNYLRVDGDKGYVYLHDNNAELADRRVGVGTESPKYRFDVSGAGAFSIVYISGQPILNSGGQLMITGARILTTADASSFTSSGNFYPLNSNPSGYIDSGQTGLFYPTANPSGFVSATQTGLLKNTFVTLTGNQTITGIKNFTSATYLPNIQSPSGNLLIRAGLNAISNSGYSVYILGASSVGAGFHGGDVGIMGGIGAKGAGGHVRISGGPAFGGAGGDVMILGGLSANQPGQILISGGASAFGNSADVILVGGYASGTTRNGHVILNTGIPECYVGVNNVTPQYTLDVSGTGWFAALYASGYRVMTTQDTGSFLTSNGISGDFKVVDSRGVTRLDIRNGPTKSSAKYTRLYDSTGKVRIAFIQEDAFNVGETVILDSHEYNRISIDPNHFYFKDWGNVDYITDRNLMDAGGANSLDWANRYFYATDGTNIVLDWNALQLKDANSLLAADWGGRYLVGEEGNSSVDWANRKLVNSGSVETLDWHNRILTGGSWAIQGLSISSGLYTFLGVGTGATPARGIFDVYGKNDITIANATSPDTSIIFNYGGGVYSVGNDYFQYQVFPFRTVNGSRVYSPTGLTFYGVDDGVTGPYSVQFSWTPTQNADGYRVRVCQDSEVGIYDQSRYFDTPNTYVDIGVSATGVDEVTLSGYTYPFSSSPTGIDIGSHFYVDTSGNLYSNKNISGYKVYGSSGMDFGGVISKSGTTVLDFDVPNYSTRVGIEAEANFGGTALGYASKAGDSSAALGANAIASGQTSNAVGVRSRALGTNSIAIGTDASGVNGVSVAIGYKANAIGTDSIAIGDVSIALGLFTVAVGNGARANGASSVALGRSTRATGINSVAIGNGANASGTNSMALGASSYAPLANTIVLGNGEYVGINNRTPVYHLDVSGSGHFRSGFYSSGFRVLTLADSGLFGGSGSTGSYYPLTSNPSGYVTSGQTGAFYPRTNPSGYVTTGQTGVYRANVVFTTGNQTIAGNKTFSDSAYAITSFGVGTDTPSQTFHVIGNSRFEVSESTDDFVIFNAASVQNVFSYDGNNGFLLLQPDMGGWVGVRTANPSFPFDVVGDTRISGSSITLIGQTTITGFRALTTADSGNFADFQKVVYTTGNQTVSGIKTFTNRIVLDSQSVLTSTFSGTTAPAHGYDLYIYGAKGSGTIIGRTADGGNVKIYGGDSANPASSYTTYGGNVYVAGGSGTSAGGAIILQGGQGAAGSRNNVVINPTGGYVGIGIENPGHSLQVQGNVSSSTSGYFLGDSGVASYFKSSVGINSSNPLYTLDVSGSGRFINFLMVSGSGYFHSGVSVSGSLKLLAGSSTASLSSNGAGTLLLNSTNGAGANVYGTLSPSSNNSTDLGANTTMWRSLYSNSGNFSGIVQNANNHSIVTNSGWSSGISINFNGVGHAVVKITGNTTFSTINRVSGIERTVNCILSGDSSNHTLTFESGWNWFVTIPTGLTANKRAWMTLTSLGSGVSDVYAAYKETV